MPKFNVYVTFTGSFEPVIVADGEDKAKEMAIEQLNQLINHPNIDINVGEEDEIYADEEEE